MAPEPLIGDVIWFIRPGRGFCEENKCMAQVMATGGDSLYPHAHDTGHHIFVDDQIVRCAEYHYGCI